MNRWSPWAGKKITAGVRRRQAQVLADTGIPEDELREKIGASEKTQLLTGFALNAAARTTLKGKLRTLGRSLASGLLAEDDATINTEQMIIAAIADIEGPQLAMLELLVAWRPGRSSHEPLIVGPLDLPKDSHDSPYGDRWGVAGREWSRELIGHARPNLAPIAPSLLGTLQRHGLVVQNANTDETVERLQRAVESAFSQMYEYVRAGGGFTTRGAPRLNTHDVAQEHTWSPTELGEQVFLRFRNAGADLNDVWTSGPDGVTVPSARRPASR